MLHKFEGFISNKGALNVGSRAQRPYNVTAGTCRTWLWKMLGIIQKRTS